MTAEVRSLATSSSPSRARIMRGPRARWVSASASRTSSCRTSSTELRTSSAWLPRTDLDVASLPRRQHRSWSATLQASTDYIPCIRYCYHRFSMKLFFRHPILICSFDLPSVQLARCAEKFLDKPLTSWLTIVKLVSGCFYVLFLVLFLFSRLFSTTKRSIYCNYRMSTHFREPLSFNGNVKFTTRS